MGKRNMPYDLVVRQEVGRVLNLSHCNLFPSHLLPESGEWVAELNFHAVESRLPAPQIHERALGQGLLAELNPHRGTVAVKAAPEELIEFFSSLR